MTLAPEATQLLDICTSLGLLFKPPAELLLLGIQSSAEKRLVIHHALVVLGDKLSFTLRELPFLPHPLFQEIVKHFAAVFEGW